MIVPFKQPQAQQPPQPQPPSSIWDDIWDLSPWSRWLRSKTQLHHVPPPTPARIAEAARELGDQWVTGTPWRRFCLAALWASTAMASLEVLVLLKGVVTLAPSANWNMLIVACGPALASLMARRGSWSLVWLIAWFWSLPAAPAFPMLGFLAAVGVVAYGAATGAFDDRDGIQDGDPQ